MSENWKIQVSPRVGDTLINLRAETPDEAERILAWATEHAADIQKAVAAFGGASAVAAVLPVASTTVQSQPGWNTGAQTPPPAFAQPAPAAAPPAGGDHMCIHGQRKFVQAKTVKADGTPTWQAWMCPTPKNTPGQCEPDWIR